MEKPEILIFPLNDDIENYKDIIMKMRVFYDLSTNKFVIYLKTRLLNVFVIFGIKLQLT